MSKAKTSNSHSRDGEMLPKMEEQTTALFALLPLHQVSKAEMQQQNSWENNLVSYTTWEHKEASSTHGKKKRSVHIQLFNLQDLQQRGNPAKAWSHQEETLHLGGRKHSSLERLWLIWFQKIWWYWSHTWCSARRTPQIQLVMNETWTYCLWAALEEELWRINHLTV